MNEFFFLKEQYFNCSEKMYAFTVLTVFCQILYLMICKIWRFLLQILSNRNDLIDTIKPFMENLNNNNINDEKFLPFLQSISKTQLEVLANNQIISPEKLN